MKILHVVPYFAPAWRFGGVVSAVVGLAEAQAAAGNSVHVLTGDLLGGGKRAQTGRTMISGVAITRVRNFSVGLRTRFNLSTPVRFRATAASLLENIQVVHCHELRTIENLCTVPLAASANIPIVLSPHGTLPYRTGQGVGKRAWDMLVGGRYMPEVDRVIALTPAEARDVNALWREMGFDLPEDQIHIIPNGINPPHQVNSPQKETFRKRWGLSRGPVAVFVGRLVRRKGLRVLVRAFAAVSAEIPTACLLIIGPDGGELRPARALVDMLGLEDRVIFTGFLNRAELQEGLSVADFFVLPAVGEGFSMAAVEALAAGLPVIAAPDCGLEEFARKGAAYIAAPDLVPLAAAIRELAQNPGQRADMGSKAKELAIGGHSWSRIAKETVSVYCEAGADSGRTSS